MEHKGHETINKVKTPEEIMADIVEKQMLDLLRVEMINLGRGQNVKEEDAKRIAKTYDFLSEKTKNKLNEHRSNRKG